jgi:hypothetical protein
MKKPNTMAVTNGDTHHRSVRKVRAEIAARADRVCSGRATPDGGEDEVVVMTSIQVGGGAWRDRFRHGLHRSPEDRRALQFSRRYN